MEQVERLEQEAADAIGSASSTQELRELELSYLGKSGKITGLMREIGKVYKEDRPRFGQAVNQAKHRLQEKLEARRASLQEGELQSQFEAERIDVTMPGRPPVAGNAHLISQTVRKIKDTLGALGFVYFEGPELEDFKYNFSALNYPDDHPAMDEQDTFYVEDDKVLRTQCTAIQGRVFEQYKPPLRFFTVGRTFRNETVDRTHMHTFHQVDCFMIDENVSMAHLKGTLGAFAREMFGPDAQVRFRPDFFPFVEPGVDYAISTKSFNDGAWLELGGAGMIHPNILENYGIDTDHYSGFAFGLGVERIPMLQKGIGDLRHFMENDLRFLEQFRG
jgi:phenylalanyl-tRNA synthetase alpha chain